jgi:hypothetical protein
LDPDWTTELIYNFEPETEYAEKLMQVNNHGTLLKASIYNVGFESFNSVYNCGGLFILVALNIIIIAFAFINKLFKKLYFKNASMFEGG